MSPYSHRPHRLYRTGESGDSCARAVYDLAGIEVKALCDLRRENVERAARILESFARPKAADYSGKGMWRKMCGRADIDLVYICTDWLTHTPSPR